MAYCSQRSHTGQLDYCSCGKYTFYKIKIQLEIEINLLEIKVRFSNTNVKHFLLYGAEMWKSAKGCLKKSYKFFFEIMMLIIEAEIVSTNKSRKRLNLGNEMDRVHVLIRADESI